MHEKSDELVEDLKKRQNNVLPHELIKRAASVDDVYWNGPHKNSKIQHVGVLILGLTFLLMGLMFVSIAARDHSWAGCLPAALPCGLGLRMIYKSFTGRTVGRESR